MPADSNSKGFIGLLKLPATARSPWWELTRRLLMAIGILLLTVFLVYFDRDGYRDGADITSARPNGIVDLSDAFYYTTVTLSTTGYGDIAPVTQTARLINAFVITPLRIAFLVLLIGTTLEVLASQGREMFRVARWRKNMDQHVVIIGYGTKGRSAVDTLVSNGTSRDSVVVVDPGAVAQEEAHADGLAIVTGDATRREVLRRAHVGTRQAGDHHHRSRRHHGAGHADGAPAEPRRLHRRGGAGGRQRAPGPAERRRLGDHLLRRGGPAARAWRPSRPTWAR